MTPSVADPCTVEFFSGWQQLALLVLFILHVCLNHHCFGFIKAVLVADFAWATKRNASNGSGTVIAGHCRDNRNLGHLLATKTVQMDKVHDREKFPVHFQFWARNSKRDFVCPSIYWSVMIDLKSEGVWGWRGCGWELYVPARPSTKIL